jgi:hypothetical protein
MGGFHSAEEPGPEQAFIARMGDNAGAQPQATQPNRLPPPAYAKPPAVRAGPVKPLQPPKIAKPPINIGDIYFQNVA